MYVYIYTIISLKWVRNELTTTKVFWISSRVGHSSKVDHVDFLSTCLFALDVFFSYWTGWWFSQIFSTLAFNHFHVLLNSQPRDLWRTPQNISGCSLSFGAQSKLPTPQFLDSNTLMLARYHCCTRCFSVLWRRPIVLWGASDSALFVGSWFQAKKWRFIQENARDGSHRVNETFTDNYFHLLDRRDGDKCWKARELQANYLDVQHFLDDTGQWNDVVLSDLAKIFERVNPLDHTCLGRAFISSLGFTLLPPHSLWPQSLA